MFPASPKKTAQRRGFPKTIQISLKLIPESQLLSPIAQGRQRSPIYGRMDSNGSAVHTGPEGKKALQSMMVQAIGSGFTLVHVLFDIVDTIKKQVAMPV